MDRMHDYVGAVEQLKTLLSHVRHNQSVYSPAALQSEVMEIAGKIPAATNMELADERLADLNDAHLTLADALAVSGALGDQSDTTLELQGSPYWSNEMPKGWVAITPMFSSSKGSSAIVELYQMQSEHNLLRVGQCQSTSGDDPFAINEHARAMAKQHGLHTLARLEDLESTDPIAIFDAESGEQQELYFVPDAKQQLAKTVSVGGFCKILADSDPEQSPAVMKSQLMMQAYPYLDPDNTMDRALADEVRSMMSTQQCMPVSLGDPTAATVRISEDELSVLAVADTARLMAGRAMDQGISESHPFITALTETDDDEKRMETALAFHETTFDHTPDDEPKTSFGLTL